MRTVAPWAVGSATAAPVLLIGGWTVAAARQPSGFDSLTDTISALAAHGAADRWVMTSALAGLGLCHVTTALGLRGARPAGRAILAAGGLATVLVAASPLPVEGSSSRHGLAAAVAFGALALWPSVSGWPGTRLPWGLRARVALPAAAGLLALVGWFAVELQGGGRVGLAERAAAGAQALWPLAVVLSCLRARADSR